MNLILFESGGAAFAIAAEAVEKVLAPPPAAPLPFAPSYAEGLVGLGGRVVVLIDLARRFGQSGGSGTMALVVRHGGADYALRIDRVRQMITIDEAALTRFPGDEEAAAADGPRRFALGELKHGAVMVLLLDPLALGLEGVAAAAPGAELLGLGETDAVAGRGSGGGEAVFATLVIGQWGERYALPLAEVREIVELGPLCDLPQAPPEVRGLTMLRDQPLLVLSLARLLGLVPPSDGPAEERLLVVLDRDGILLGLSVERVTGLASWLESERRPLSDGRLDGLDSYVVDRQGRLVALVESSWLLTAARLAALRHLLPRPVQAATRSGTGQSGRVRSYLSFWVGDDLFALDLSVVERVAEYRRPESLPARSAHPFAGVTELAGRVVPVLDLRAALGTGMPRNGAAAFVMAHLGGAASALVVDRLNRVIRVADDSLAPAGNPSSLVAQVAEHGGRIVSVLGLDGLCAAARDGRPA